MFDPARVNKFHEFLSRTQGAFILQAKKKRFRTIVNVDGTKTKVQREVAYQCHKANGTGNKNKRIKQHQPLNPIRKSSSSKASCDWKIVYRRNEFGAITFAKNSATNKRYHSHSLGSKADEIRRAAGRGDEVWKDSLKDMSKEQVQDIMDWHAAGCDRQQIRTLSKLYHGIDHLTKSLLDVLTRMARAKEGGATNAEMRSALAKLHEMGKNGEVLFYYTTNPENEEVDKLFWIYTTQMESWRCFGKFVVLDATAKTNRFGYPLILFTLVAYLIPLRTYVGSVPYEFMDGRCL